MAKILFEGYDPDSAGYYNATVVDGENLPPGGGPGQVLVKTSWNDFDCTWMSVYVDSEGTGGGGDPGTGTGGDITLDSVAPIRVQGGGSAWTISIDAASQLRPGSMSAADKRRLDNLPSTISRNPPSGPRPGDLWWNTTDGTGYIFYSDGSSTQWVPFTPQSGIEQDEGGYS